METLKVLIVDDETAMGKAVERSLRNYGVHVPEVGLDVDYRVEHVETGEEALKIIDNRPPDILLLDNKLPGISGIEILSHLCENPRDLLTVMITAYASLENAIAATRRGAHDFLAKPFTPEELKGIVYRTSKHLLLCRHAEKMAQEKHRIRFEFLSVLAHELKSPLAAVAQYLELMRNADPAAEAGFIRTAADRCLERIGDMRKLILDLLDVTRLESGQRPRQIQNVDLVRAAEKALESMGEEAARRSIALRIHAGGPLNVPADPWEVETILNNLVSNAVKYNRENGRVDVSITKENGAAVIRVADTGIGISEEEAPKVFSEFARIRNDDTETISGSGLGLSIVKKIAALYDGDVSFESTPGKGCTFRVLLPAAKQPGA